MKCTHIIIYFSLLHLFSCKSTQIYVKEDNLCNRNYKILKKEKKLNVSKYQKVTTEPLITSENDSVINSYYKSGRKKNNQIALYTYFKKRKILRTLSYNLKKGTIIYERYTLYNSDVGVFRKYDTNGNVIDSTKYTSPKNYKICYYEALEIVKEKIKSKKKYNRNDYLLNRLPLTAEPKEYPYKWSIIINPVKGNKKWLPPIEYIVDAMTGKIIIIRKKNRR